MLDLIDVLGESTLKEKLCIWNSDYESCDFTRKEVVKTDSITSKLVHCGTTLKETIEKDEFKRNVEHATSHRVHYH